jgi:3',5'-cyclic AMP phosphodiesterase CpdA
MKYSKQNLIFRLMPILLILFISSCADPYPFLYEIDETVKELVRENNPHYPDMKFAVLADLHYFSPELIVEGDAFQDYLDHDRKMLMEGPEILDTALEKIKRLDLNFIIICGDLTKDGEYLSHQQVAKKLQTLTSAGTSVYVIPGNHDVNNPEANRYNGDETEPVPTVSPKEFEEIYHQYGYSKGLYKDPDSLSFVVEPVAGLWLFALDSCRYRENLENQHHMVDGTFYPDTLLWIEQKLIEAIQKKKAVIGFFHHGILEHYNSNEQHYGDYLLDDFQYISEMLAAYGMRFVFTGHFHAQDITLKQWPESDIENHFLFDIETGSLVTYPVPWRLIQISNQEMSIMSSRIESINSHPNDFQGFARDFVRQGTILLADEALTGYGVPEEDQMLLSPQIAEAYIAHIQGDEVVPDPILDLTGLSPIGLGVIALQGSLIEGWFNDLLPADNEIVINMTEGEVSSE